MKIFKINQKNNKNKIIKDKTNNSIKKILSIKNLAKLFILAMLLFIYSTISAFSYAKTVSSDLADSVFRLHVLANSDSEEDQNLKYLVRDNLISYMNELCANTTSKEEAIEIANNHIDEFKSIALNTIYENGYSYDVNIEIGNFEFPTKYYGDISFPAGYYDAIRVEIGEAEGENWWCVMFPPLCFVDISSGVVPDESKEILDDTLSEEEFALVSDDKDISIEFKFKILEFFSDYSIFTAES